jgi:hypothetical protein
VSHALTSNIHQCQVQDQAECMMCSKVKCAAQSMQALARIKQKSGARHQQEELITDQTSMLCSAHQNGAGIMPMHNCHTHPTTLVLCVDSRAWCALPVYSSPHVTGARQRELTHPDAAGRLMATQHDEGNDSTAQLSTALPTQLNTVQRCTISAVGSSALYQQCHCNEVTAT